MKEAGLTIDLKKTHFCFKEPRYLGFVIGGGVLKTYPGKVKGHQKHADFKECQ